MQEKKWKNRLAIFSMFFGVVAVLLFSLMMPAPSQAASPSAGQAHPWHVGIAAKAGFPWSGIEAEAPLTENLAAVGFYGMMPLPFLVTQGELLGLRYYWPLKWTRLMATGYVGKQMIVAILPGSQPVDYGAFGVSGGAEFPFTFGLRLGVELGYVGSWQVSSSSNQAPLSWPMLNAVVGWRF